MASEARVDGGIMDVEISGAGTEGGLVAQLKAAQARAEEGLPAPGADSSLTETPAPAPATPPAAEPKAEAPGTVQPDDSPKVAEVKPLPGESIENYRKRLADAQTSVHESKAETKEVKAELVKTQAELDTERAKSAELNNQLAAVLSNPELLLVAGRPAATDLEAKYQAALAAYKAAPNDDEAVLGLMRTTKALALEEMREEQSQGQIQAENTRRQGLTRLALQAQVQTYVQAEAPDVPIKLFWGFASTVAQNTPPVVMALPLAERIAWQTREAIALCRDALDGPAKKALAAATTGKAIERGAAVVMAGGGSSTPAAAGERPKLANGIPTAGPGSGPSMVDELRSFQSKAFDRTPA